MIRLLKIEFLKIRTYKIFWILTGLYFLFLGLGIFLAEFILNSWVNNFNSRFPVPIPHVTLYFFPDIWQNITFFASIRYILIFPALVIIILITNEFTYKTIRQNVVTGMSKMEFLTSKLLLILLFSVVITIIVGIVTLVLGISHSDSDQMKLILTKIWFLPSFFIQMLTYLIFAFTFGFLLRHTGLSIALFILYSLIIEPVIFYVLKIPFFQPNSVSQYLPVNSVLRVVEYPSIPFLQKFMGLTLQNQVSLAHCGIALLYAIILAGSVFLVMSKKDL
ncbi:MAG: ABC transporter permease [Bacteroidota bacterium]